MVAPADSFVGRQHELALLLALLERAREGRGQIVMLAGEPGIGKTRIAQELAEHVTGGDATVLWGRCPEESGAPAYWPWGQIIRTSLRDPSADTLLRSLGPSASDMVDVLPDIHDRLPGLEPSAPLDDPAAARWRMFDSIRSFLTRLTESQPVLLLLDDLHWADVPSLRLLEFVARELADSRLLVVGTYRASELSRQHPLSNALGGFARLPHVTRLHLTGLSIDEAQDFIAATAGTVPPAWLATSLHTQTEGNPLFLREIVRFLQQQGVFDSDGTVAIASLPATVRIPEGVKEVIGRRLNLLSAPCNEVLAIAAVIGRTFTHEVLLRAVENLSEDALIEALDEALAVHVIEEAANGSYQFTHALVRMTLYDELRAVRRRSLHRRVGSAIEALHRADSDTVLPELARHFHAAGDIDRAIDYAMWAGQRAERLLSFEDAAQFFQAALDAMEQCVEVDEAARCRLLLLLGEAQRKCGDFRPATTTLREAADLARELGLHDVLAQAALGCERAAWRTDRHPEVRPERLLADALHMVPPSEKALRVEVMGGLARSLLHAGLVTEAREQLDQAIGGARRLGDPGLLAVTLHYLFDFPSGPDDIPERLARATEMLQAARQASNFEMVALAHTRRMVLSLELGDVQTADSDLEQLALITARIRQPIFSSVLLGGRALQAQLRGELDTAEKLLGQALVENRRGSAGFSDFLSVQIFTLRREQGRLREIQPLLAMFRQQPDGGATWRPGLAILYLELGQIDDARSEFEHLAANDFAGIPRDGRWMTCMVYLAEICVALGDAARAQILYRLLLPYAHRLALLGGGVACDGSSDRFLGMLCTATGNWQQAQQHFEDALAMNARIGARAPLAHTRHDYATMLLRRDAPGDRARAQSLLQECLEGARHLGMRALEQRVAARIEQQRGTTSDELTPREAEVLELLAIGRSNADIAMVLAISLNTVATHVRNIFAKTGCANRTEAAAYAMRHGMARAGNRA